MPKDESREAQKAANEARLAKLSEDKLLELLSRATAFATRCIKENCWRSAGSGGVLPEGSGPEDIVQRAFERLLDGAKWDEDKTLEMVLMGLVKGHVANLVRLLENKRTINPGDIKDNEDEAEQSKEKWTPKENLNPAHLMERAEDDEAALEILESFERDSQEYRIVEAILGGTTKRAEILQETGISASEYEAAKKRLRTFLQKFWQIRAANQHKGERAQV